MNVVDLFLIISCFFTARVIDKRWAYFFALGFAAPAVVRLFV